MPNPAFEKIKQSVTLAAKVGEKAVRTAAPVVRRTADDLVGRIRKSDGDPSPVPQPRAPQSPSPDAETSTTAASTTAASTTETGDKPSPASIAKNVPHQRPLAKPTKPAKPAAPATRAASDSPGGKLPPRR